MLLRPIGWRANGRPILPIMGASESPPEGGQQPPADPPPQPGSGGQETAPSGDGTEGQGQPSAGQPDTVSREEFDRVRQRMQAADRRADAAENRVREFEQANQSELERAQSRAETAEQAQQQLTGDIESLRIENAFLSSNRHSWYDPEDALALADLSEVSVDDNGQVDRQTLSRALDDLAKRKPHLVKPAEQPPPPGNDSNVGSGRNAPNNGISDQEIRRKYRLRR